MPKHSARKLLEAYDFSPLRLCSICYTVLYKIVCFLRHWEYSEGVLCRAWKSCEFNRAHSRNPMRLRDIAKSFSHDTVKDSGVSTSHSKTEPWAVEHIYRVVLVETRIKLRKDLDVLAANHAHSAASKISGFAILYGDSRQETLWWKAIQGISCWPSRPERIPLTAK